MRVLQKKICMIGAPGVGKTSLVARYVHGIFSERYLSTIGVKIDRKVLERQHDRLQLMLWDINGNGTLNQLTMSYMRGASGYLLVADGSRAETLDTAASLQAQLASAHADLPFVLLLNKADLRSAWQLEPTAVEALGWPWLETSAKDGLGVEQAFSKLAQYL